MDPVFRKVIYSGAFVGLIVGIGTSFLPSDNPILPISVGFASWGIVVLIYLVLSSAGNTFGSSLFGMGREVDTREIHAEVVLEKAENSHKAKKFEQSIKFYQEYLASGLDKKPERTAMKIAQIFEEDLGNFREARYWFRRSIALSCKEGVCGENIFARESQHALSRLDKLEETTRHSVVDNLLIIKQLIEKEDFEQAEPKLRELLKLYPKNSEIEYLFGHYYLFRQNLGMAIEHFKRALEKDENHVLAAFYIATATQDLGNLLEAREAFDAYMKIARDIPEESDRINQAVERLAQIEKDLENPFIN
jgi:tetratricopeptide (TPR) repeat protein